MSGLLISAPRTLLAAGLVFSAAATAGHARLGETFDLMKERMGKPAPQVKRDPNSAVWFFEGQDGQLIYTATFNAKGLSIAEGLKPDAHAVFSRAVAQNFIDGQMAPYRGSKTVRAINPGEKYTFAGKDFVCGDKEQVVVDDANGILVVWTQGALPSVLAVRPEMIK